MSSWVRVWAGRSSPGSTGKSGSIGGCAAFAAGVFAALLFVKARGAGGAGFVVWGAVACAASAALARRLSFVRTVAVLFAATALYLVVYPYVVARLR